MKTNHGHLTYCTNIHQGEDWESHFRALKNHFASIKSKVSPEGPMGIGLRLSYQAVQELIEKEKLNEFQDWLKQEQAYVFTMNGFPYGEFHKGAVKDNVHRPDWTTNERRDYTIDLFNVLSHLLPEGMEGGVSTSPLSYRHWFIDEPALKEATLLATKNILQVVESLIHILHDQGKTLHLDIEPEPDGILETGREFIDWYEQSLLPMGKQFLAERLQLSPQEAEDALKTHVHLCYDVCHFALGYEHHTDIIDELTQKGIQVGKIQISAALKATLPMDTAIRAKVISAFERYDEPVYLHQVIEKRKRGEIIRYRDLPQALENSAKSEEVEWRAHFHVPVFLAEFTPLQSTQSDILRVLERHQAKNFTQHLEVETYTWEVLPPELKLPLNESIERELLWVKKQLT